MISIYLLPDCFIEQLKIEILIQISSFRNSY